MDWPALMWHMAGLLAPALVLAPVVVGVSRLLWRPAGTGLWQGAGRQLALNLAACALTLLAGLALTGHDGRMLTYAALCLASAACQGWLLGLSKK